MSLFRDENLRSALIKKGKSQVEKYNWNEAADSFWQTIENNTLISFYSFL